MPGNSEATIFVANLDDRVDEHVLYEVMVQAGPLVEVYMPRDKETKRHKGYGFAEYHTIESANYALKLFQGQVNFHNRPIRFAISGGEKNNNNQAKQAPQEGHDRQLKEPQERQFKEPRPRERSPERYRSPERAKYYHKDRSPDYYNERSPERAKHHHKERSPHRGSNHGSRYRDRSLERTYDYDCSSRYRSGSRDHSASTGKLVAFDDDRYGRRHDRRYNPY